MPTLDRIQLGVRGLLLAPLALLACTDAGLQPVGESVTYVDNQLAVSGEFCSSPPDEVTFPVKLLIMMDQSASLQCMDPTNARLAAFADAGAALDPLPNVEFGVVGFASWSKTTIFTPDWDTANAALAPQNGQGGPATDYQGSLATTLTLLEQDMLDSGPAEVARTKYVVVFVSDGVPEPRCQAGCDDGDAPPDALYGVCNTTLTIPKGEYVDMNGPCPEYNQEHQILQKVQDIMALADFHGAGDLTFNTVFLWADDATVAGVCGDVSQFGYIRGEAEPLLRSMAETGNGTYRDLNTSSELDFLEYDFESLEAPYEVAEFFAYNSNAIPHEGSMAMDSDSDGMPDPDEFEVHLDRLIGDSDGDGYGDNFEHRFAGNGFDALDPALPASGCADPGDRDQDGLTACEETYLTTDDLLPDSDGDRIPDGIEIKLGMDPAVQDTLVDHDLDGRLSGIEIRTGTHPLQFDEEDSLLNQIRYSVNAGEPRQDGSRCYDWSFQGLTLVPTLATSDGQKGRNRIMILAEEEPTGLAGSRGRFHVACVEARYLGDGQFKAPPDGLIENVSQYRFVEVQNFDPDLHCLQVDSDPERIPEWASQ